MKQYLIIVRGPPGTGKSTISRELAKKLPGTVTILDSDALRWEFIPKREKNFSDHNLLYKNLWCMTKNSLDEGLNVIIEGILTSKNKNNKFRINKYNYYKKNKDVKLTKIFLESSPEVQKDRIKNRNRKLKPNDVISWTKLSYESISEDEHKVSTDKKTVGKIVNEILYIVKYL